MAERIETSDNGFAVRQTQHGDDEMLFTKIIECQHRSLAFAWHRFANGSVEFIGLIVTRDGRAGYSGNSSHQFRQTVTVVVFFFVSFALLRSGMKHFQGLFSFLTPSLLPKRQECIGFVRRMI